MNCISVLLCAALASQVAVPVALGQNAADQTSPSGTLVSHVMPTGETLHLVVGRSMSIVTETRLRKVYVGNPPVLDSVTDTPTHIVISAKSAGTSSLILSDEVGHSQVYLVVADMDVNGLQSDLEATFPGEHLRAESQEGRISLYGTVGSDASADAVLKLASLYSKDVANSLLVNPSRAKQVRLKVRIVEVDRSKLNEFGVNFFSGGKNISSSTVGQFPVTTNITSGGSATTGTSSTFTISDPLNLLFYNTNLNIGVAIRDLENRQILQILAEPNITTVSGQKASFLSGGEFPFPVVQSAAAGLASISIQFRPYGVKVDFTPIVNPDGTIQLKVAPEVSALDYTNAVAIAGYTIPALSTRRAETQVQLRDGQSFAISGLLDHRTTDILGQVPGFGQLPVLGALFRSKTINRSTVELIVIVTPTVVDPITNTTEPHEPELPVPMLDTAPFDKKVVGNSSKVIATEGPK